MATTNQRVTGIPQAGGAALQGLALATKLDYRRNAVLAVLGDSTGNEASEWVYQLGQRIAAEDPSARVEHFLWSDPTQAYGAADIVQAGALAPTLTFQDNFGGTSLELVGRAPDVIGNAWGQDGSGALGDWSVSGGLLVRSSDAAVSTPLFSGSVQGDQTITLTGVNFSTVGDGSNRTFSVITKWVNASNYLVARMVVGAAGSVTVNLVKAIAGALTQIATVSSPAGIALNTAGQTKNITVRITGTTFSYDIDGTVVVSAEILPGEAIALAPSLGGGIVGGLGNLIGMTIQALSLVVTPTTGTVRTVSIYNGSMPGATWAYHASRLPAMLPVTPDWAFLSFSHNHGALASDAFSLITRQAIAAVQALRPATTPAVCSQNPEKSPSANVVAHAARMEVLRAITAELGLPYMPIYETFVKTPGFQALIESDGIHPTKGASSGSSLWADTVWAEINKLRLTV